MSWTHTRAKIAATKKKDPNADTTDLRRQLRAERTAAYIEKVLAEAPPLSDEQRIALAELLAPIRKTRAGGGVA